VLNVVGLVEHLHIYDTLAGALAEDPADRLRPTPR
jgi:hypothetical protein